MNIQVYGKNAVRAALETHNALTLFTFERFKGEELVSLARSLNVPVKFVSDNELAKLAKTPSHQGYVATCQAVKTYSIDGLLDSVPKTKEYPLILLLDGIEDPHNLGAILRSADAFGVDGIVMKKRGEVPLNGTVAKVSTGAIFYSKVALVPNLSLAIFKMKEKGYWIVSSADKGAVDYLDVDYRCPIGLVVGNEGKGISQLVISNSDFIVRIPMKGHVSCLNASVAASVLISGIITARD